MVLPMGTFKGRLLPTRYEVHSMGLGKKKKYGRGPYADKKMRYVTLEQKWSALKKWYDEALKDSRLANPARNARLEKVP